MSTALQTLHFNHLVPVNSLESYITGVQAIPMLTLEEEQELSQRYYTHQDIEAARRLVMAHLRFVVRIARGYLGYGLAHADLIQEGNIGLMKAVQRFNPNVGVRLATFAIHWIKAEIHEFILRNWRIVKIATTKAQRKLFFNLRQLKKEKNRLTWLTPDEIKDVAKELNVSTKDVAQMELRLNNPDTSFEMPTNEDENHNIYLAPENYLEDHQNNPAVELEATNDREYSAQHVSTALKNLDERSRMIITKRWLIEKKATLHDLAAQFKVSAERIRQLEKTAFEKLKAELRNAEH